MAMLLPQASGALIKIGPFVDATDAHTPESAITPVLLIAKGSGDFGARSASDAITHDAHGWYNVVLNNIDTNTLGRLIISSTGTAHLPVWKDDIFIVPSAIYDGWITGHDNIPVAVVTNADKTGYSLTNGQQVTVSGLTDSVITAASIQSNAITAAKIATDAIDADAVADGVTVTTSGLTDNVITASSIASNAITAAKIATDAIDADAVADDVTVTASGITLGAQDLVASGVWGALRATHSGVANTYGEWVPSNPLLLDSDADALDNLVALADNTNRGTARGGASTSLQLKAGESDTTDLYNGMAITLINGLGKGQARLITDYNGSGTGPSDEHTITVFPAWVTTPDATTDYVVSTWAYGFLPTTDIDAIADQVWDETRSDHTTEDSFGEGVKVATSGITSDSFASQAITSGVFATGAITNHAVVDNLTVTTSGLSDNTITAASIASNAITAAKIATDAIDADAVADGVTVTTSGLTDNVITAASIAGNAITSAKIATDAIDSDAVADGVTVTVSGLTDGVITNAAMADNAIDNDVIADSAISQTKIAGNTITSQKINDTAIRAQHFQNSTFGSGVFATGSAGAFVQLNVFHADINLSVDTSNSLDEWTVTWFKNGEPITQGITNATLRVINRSNGSALIDSSGMTEIGSSHSFKYDAWNTERITAGEAVVAIASGTIESATRQFRRVISRDSS